VPYVDVSGLRTWHEVSGDGDPVVLLHGGLSGGDSWQAQQPALARAGYRVYVPDRRGHGHTADVPGPFSYQVMADDTIGYLAQVVGRPAHLVGWSDGAVVALLASQQRPGLVASLVLIGQYYNSTGRIPGGLQDLLLTANPEVMNFLRASYGPVSPDGPDHFPVVYEKTMQMYRTEPEIDLATLAMVPAPALVLQGDRDEVRLEHSAAVARALPHGRLAVLPGSHLLPVESPGLVNAVILAFLSGRIGTSR
jgi:pimeloyl-ACP methyl ester carboxylesterase